MRTLLLWVILSVTLSAQYRRGVNIAGAEFGQDTFPGEFGRHYTFNSEPTFRYFAQKNLGLYRIPLRWERLQPALRGPLDPDYVARLKENVAWAKANGAEVIIDLHNFGRYVIGETAYVIDNRGAGGLRRVSAADFVDVWVRLSNEFRFDGTVWAYDLMNEPHDMGMADWKHISNAVVNAIRGNQDDKLILVSGDSWSSGNRWLTTHGPNGWITDPANNFMYQAHQYFDRDESGTYGLSYDAELARDPDLENVGRRRIRGFIDWCQANGVRCMAGEYGVPDTDVRWLRVLDGFLQALDAAGMDGAYWAAGDWWGPYPLSVQPTLNYTLDRPQMRTLEAHSGKGYLSSFSAAAVNVQRAASGSLVTIYGRDFASAAESATTVPLPTLLAGVTVEVTDASGAAAFAPLLYVGPGQVNLQMPENLRAGRARLTVRQGLREVASGGIAVAASAPAVFTANSAGYGLAAAQIVRVRADGSQALENVVAWDQSAGGFVPLPVSMGAGTDRVFLVLYATGLHASSVVVHVGCVDVPASYAGPQGQFAGLDQVNVELPRTLADTPGEVPVTVKAGGEVANTVTIVVQR